MKNIRVFLFIIIISTVITYIPQGFTLDKRAHEEINGRSAQTSINDYSLDIYLRDTSGFQDGVREFLFGYSEKKRQEVKQRVWEWIAEGGYKEDEPENIPRYLTRMARNNNHFHNPLITNWRNAGLDAYIWIPTIPPTQLPIAGNSSVLWAHTMNQNLGGNWSWHDARRYYYEGLTLTDKNEREKSLAKCFKALGHLMHLVQDASVPAHVRNDIHTIYYHYEYWIEDIRNSRDPIERKIFDDSFVRPITFDESILKIGLKPLPSIEGYELTPMARILDTDEYYGGNPEVTLTDRIGIAEYTNANFFSEDTVSGENDQFKTFNSPLISNTNVENYLIPDPRRKNEFVTRPYYVKKGNDQYRLATVGFLKDYIMNHIPWYRGLELRSLDEGVYKDYAERLLPRAVGYSAGILKYFFRGDLYVRLLVPSVDEVTFNFGNQNDTGRDIDKVAVLIQNKSKLNGGVEPIGKGKITLIVSYTNAITGETIYRHGGTGDLEANQIPPFGDSTFLGVLFTLGEPIRTEIARDITYYLSFKGELGEEKEAVIGKVIKGPAISLAYPDRGIEDDIVRMVVDNLPDIKEPFPLKTQDISFNHSVRWPYMAEVVDRRDNEIFVKVPNTAAIVKPGYGGLRVRKIVGSGETEETIFSNPVPFFPIAEGIVKNLGDTTQIVTMKAVKPITGDYQVPDPITFTVPPDGSVPIELFTGFTYDAVDAGGIPWTEQDIYTLTPDDIDFEFDIEFQ